MGVCKARESVRKTTKEGIQGKVEDPCDQGLDRARLWVSPFSQGHEVCRAQIYHEAACGVKIHAFSFGAQATLDFGIHWVEAHGAVDGNALGNLVSTGRTFEFSFGYIGGEYSPDSSAGYTIGAGAGFFADSRSYFEVMGCSYNFPEYEGIEECLEKAKGGCARTEFFYPLY